MTSFAGLKAKAYSCLVDEEGNENEYIKKLKELRNQLLKN